MLSTMDVVNLVLFGSILAAALVIVPAVRGQARRAQREWETGGKAAMDDAARQMERLHAGLERAAQGLRRDGDAIVARVRRDAGGR